MKFRDSTDPLWLADMKFGRAPDHWAWPPLTAPDLEANHVGHLEVDGLSQEDLVLLGAEINELISGVDFFGKTTRFKPPTHTTRSVEAAIERRTGRPVCLSPYRDQLDGWWAEGVQISLHLD